MATMTMTHDDERLITLHAEKKALFAKMTEKQADIARITSTTAELNSLFGAYKKKYGDSKVNLEADGAAVAGMLAALKSEIENIEHHKPQLFSKAASK